MDIDKITLDKFMLDDIERLVKDAEWYEARLMKVREKLNERINSTINKEFKHVKFKVGTIIPLVLVLDWQDEDHKGATLDEVKEFAFRARKGEAITTVDVINYLA